MKYKFLSALLLISFYTTTLFAQTKEEKKKEAELAKIREEVYSSGDKDFDVTAIPDKWKNESAVILCQKLTQIFDKTGANYGVGSNKGISTTETLRKRIKLLDKKAVDDFSEYYFQSTDNIGVRIIKPNGSKSDVKMSDAVEVKSNTDVPSLYRTYYSFSSKYKKIAIPDLQVGDIIDYFYKVSDQNYLVGNFYPFNDVIISLCNSYPTLKQKIEFKIEKRFYINIKSVNGAPTLKPQSNDETFFVYTLTDTDRDKFFDERWVFPYRSTPTIKYQVFYVQNKSTNTNYAIGEPGVPKTNITADEAVEQMKGIYDDSKNLFVMSTASYVYDCVSDKMGKETDPVKIATQAYYCLRGYYSTPGIFESFPGYLDQPYDIVKDALTNKNMYNAANNTIGDEYFVQIMSMVLKRKKVPFNVAFAVPRRIGNMDEAILANEFLWSIYMEGKQPYFMTPLDYFSHPKNPDYRIEGVEAYVINPKASSKDKSYKTIKIPSTTAADNVTIEKSVVTIDENMEFTTLKRNLTIKGHNKDPYFESTIMQMDYMDAEMTTYGLKPRFIYKGKKDKMAEIDKAVKSTRDEVIKDRLESLKKELEGDGWEVESYDSFKIINDGRSPQKQDVVYEDSFKAKNMVKKVGPNYIFDVGKLIGSQLQIKEDEQTRHYDIYMNNPRSFTYEIQVTVPDGYKVEGIDKLNMTLDNSTGSFVSNAKVEGTTLIITSSKVYKTNFEEKAKWPEMIKFLDEAYKFTQAKVVFKKS